MTASPRAQGPKAGRKIGYVRVSSAEQNLELQLQALDRAGCTVIYRDDGVSATDRRRPAFEKALRRLRRGDVLVIWKLDRAFRSAIHALRVLYNLRRRGVDFVSTTQAIDTTTAIGRMIYGVLAVFGEFEVEQIRERTKAGLEAARNRGVRLGRPPKLTPRQVAEARRLYRAGGATYEELGRELGVSGITVSRAVNGMKSTTNERMEATS